jgi:hypothetical protein
MGSGYLATVLADQPLRLYPLNETSGTVARDLVANQSGTINGGVTLGTASIVAGDSGPAMTFDGSTGYISLPLTGLPSGANPWSIEAWVMMPTLPTAGRGAVIGFGSFVASEMAELQYYQTADQWVLSCYSADIGGPNNAVSPDMIYHLVGTYDGVTTRLYANGTLSASGTFTLNVTPAFANIGAGGTSPTDWFKGIIQYVAIYAYALTPQQIQTHYQVGTGASPVAPALRTPTTLYLYKQQMVLVYSSSGAFIDVWRDAPLLAGVKFAINSATSPLRVKLPRSFENFDEAGVPGNLGSIGQGNVVQYWLFGPGLPTGGLLKFQGKIDAYSPQITQSGEESVTVSITPFDSAVGDSGITGVQSFGTPGVPASYVDPVTMFNWWFQNNDPLTGVPYSVALTLDAANPTTSGNAAAYTFSNQSLGSIFETIRQMLPANWFWRINADKSVTLNVPPSTAQHQFVIGQHIVEPQYTKDWNRLRNVAHVVGNGLSTQLTAALTNGTPYTSLSVQALPVAMVAGQQMLINDGGSPEQYVTLSANAAQGATSVSVTSFTANSNYGVGIQVSILVQAVKQGSDLATYGKRLVQVADNRVTDQNTANILAQGLINQFDQMLLRTKIRVVDYRGDTQTGLGYDIETIKPGDTCQILDPLGNTSTTLWDQAVWDTSVWDYSPSAALSQVAIIFVVDYAFDYVDLQLGWFAPNQDRELLNVQTALADFTLA